jgi:CheY-like chemotaxis protein
MPGAPLVLLVDDYEDNRRLFAEYLELSGFRTAVAGNGEEGLAKANELHPEVIVMDLAMPDLDGFEVTRRLRAEESTRRTPVIALTAYPIGYSRHAAMEAGLRCVPDQAVRTSSAPGRDPPPARRPRLTPPGPAQCWWPSSCADSPSLAPPS